MAKTCRKWKINLHFCSYNIRYCWIVWLTKNSRVCYLVYELQIINFHCRHFSQRMVKNKSKRLPHPSTLYLRVAKPLYFHPSITKAHSGVGHWWISMRLHSVSYQKTVFFTVQSQRTSNLIDMLISTLISVPKCVSSNGCVHYHHLQLYSPEWALASSGVYISCSKIYQYNTLTDDSIKFTLNTPWLPWNV